jgi:hypothetical protein
VLRVLRVIGVLNAAVWFGGGLFFSFGIAPGVFSPELKRALSDYQVGVVGQHLVGRFFALHAICGGIALLHFAVEWMLARRGFRAGMLALIVVAAGLGAGGGAALQPRMRILFETKYHGPMDAERAAAAKSFRALHGVSQVANLVTLLLLAVYAGRLSGGNAGNLPTSAVDIRHSR